MTTVANSTLYVNLSERIGSDYLAETNLKVTGINEIDMRGMTVPITEIEILKFGTDLAAGTYSKSDMRYARITNNDDENFIRLRLKKLLSNSITTLGSITAGSSYTNGIYTNVPLTGGTGTGAIANIAVVGGVVTAVSLVNGGKDYTVGDTLSASYWLIGGTGSGFSIPVTAKGSVSHTFDHKLAAGCPFVICNTTINTNSNNAAFAVFNDIDSISAQADTAAVDIQIYVASV